ncbi:MAG TPA: VWD domain-containing protein [Solirubrobacteraceae bacterium]|nr:VWD domain-containing protein [Solirubrobacteraceae bacterium]
MRPGLLAVAVVVGALMFSAPAALAHAEIGPAVPELTHLADEGQALLNAHLSPDLHVPVHIGWLTNAAPGDKSPAYTSASAVSGLFCQIAVYKPIFDNDAGGNMSWAEEIITHELFHCYQQQIEGDADSEVSATESWVQEGLARWVDTTLFASDPIFISRDSVRGYFMTSTTALFDRSYDAVGFWGHLQDLADNLWHRIPGILTAAVHGRDTALHAALAGVSPDRFFDTWGSSAFNDAAGGDAWTARSPLPTAGFSAPARTISATTSVSLDPDSTDQLMISIPAAPTGDIETVHIDLGHAYGRFGVSSNYTGSALEKLTFCGGPSGCTAPVTPTGPACGAGETYTPPPELTPLPSDPVLGLAAAQVHANVSIDYAAVPVDTATSGTCTPTPTPPSGPGTASTFGDPHLIDFNGGLFDFQQAGEFTLLKSTGDDFQIQMRQQPEGNCCVAFNTAVAMRVGAKTVELVPNGPDGLVVYLNKHRTFDRRIALGTAGALRLTTQNRAPLAEVSLADHSTVQVYNVFGALGIDISLASDRSGHLTGLLGDWGGPAATEFVGRNGHRYAPSVITGTSTRDVRIRYREFGASWRITQRQSLFQYSRGETTRSFLVHGFPHKPLTLAGLRRALRALAEKLCRAAGITKTQLLDACALDVGATGRRGFATGDARVVRALGATAPGWIRLSSAASTPAPFPPALAEQSGSVLAAYAAGESKAIEVARFSATPGAPGPVSRTDPIAGWTNLDGVFLTPGAGGGEQLLVSGQHSNAVGDPLNGLDALAQQPGGSFGAPAPVASTGAAGDAGSVVLAHDGRTLLWSTNGLLGVENGSTNPPTDENLTYPNGVTLEFTTDAKLATDSTGRLWLAWDGQSSAGGARGIYLLQLDPETGASLPTATPQLAPDSSGVTNAAALALACNSICHVVYTPGGSATRLVSWAPGQAAPVTVVDDTAAHAYVIGLAAAAAADGHLWVVYETAIGHPATGNTPPTVADAQINTKLGDDNGAGATATVSPAAVAGAFAYDGTALATADGVVIAADWLTSTTTPTGGVWATVVRTP